MEEDIRSFGQRIIDVLLCFGYSVFKVGIYFFAIFGFVLASLCFSKLSNSPVMVIYCLKIIEVWLSILILIVVICATLWVLFKFIDSIKKFERNKKEKHKEEFKKVVSDIVRNELKSFKTRKK
jgi:hypothetical protein